MKALVKRLLPESALAWLRGCESDMKLRRETLHQMKRFRRNYARRGSTRKSHLETRIVFFTHQIEKGLSHTDFRYGFGKKVLHEYRVRHETKQFDLTYAKDLFSQRIWNEIEFTNDRSGGDLIIRSADKRDNAELSFSQLMEQRHSVREFAETPVTVEEIMNAVRVAMRTPSVCNRQPTRVHIITDAELIKKAMPLQGGFRGYPMPPALVLITGDNQTMMNQDERNECYTDGGLFGMSLLLALEEQQIAACPLNTMLPMKRDEATRELLHIPDSEFLVMYIAVGHFRDEVKTCKSQRFSADEIVTVHA